MKLHQRKFCNGQNTMQQSFDVCGTSEVRDGEARMFVINDVRIGVYNIRGEFFAIEDYCPHAGASLAHGFIGDETVTCRMHHWRFSIRSGEYLDESKPDCDLRLFAVRVIEDRIHINVD